MTENSIFVEAESVLKALNDGGFSEAQQLLVLKTAASFLEHKQQQDAMGVLMQANMQKLAGG